MIESRCGIVCSKCEYKEKVNCAGCVNITKSFFGEACPIKNCAEEKKLNHCGECQTFPCELLNQFSYDKEQGDNGKRIEQCRMWKENKEK